MVRDDKNITGNAKYEGFCIDLLKWIATQVGFQYTIKLVPDHMYGVYDPETGQWNGIVRELMEKVKCVFIYLCYHPVGQRGYMTGRLFNDTTTSERKYTGRMYKIYF